MGLHGGLLLEHLIAEPWSGPVGRLTGGILDGAGEVLTPGFIEPSWLGSKKSWLPRMASPFTIISSTAMSSSPEGLDFLTIGDSW